MVDDPKKDDLAREDSDEMISTERSRGSGIIFVLVAIALILAISFFYLTKERDEGPVGQITESDSAAYVIGDSARDAADTLRNRN